MHFSKKKLLPFFKQNNKRQKSEYVLTSFVILRFLGFIYFIAFLSLATQVIPLIGENGLLPAKNFLNTFGFESKFDAFVHLPTIFWFHLSDKSLLFFSWAGVILSLIVLIGFANVPLLFLLWFIYTCFVGYCMVLIKNQGNSFGF